ncbi:PEP-CTERM sorting domain-containing protein [uncultured Sphingomonas sp.]|uniref:PEP-CTERM sorting domain-containing protein n=1 Tax=uncultured Sphingomonas sp. TaxID=158754 RepID=UPI0035CB6F30
MLTLFSVASGFVSGQNVLAFWVIDIAGPPSALVVDRIEGSVQPQATGAVPEPAGWAMMLFGFGGVG